jgi:hypothetical protein
MIANHNWHKLNDSWGFIRSDTLKRTYYHFPVLNVDTLDHLLYDFSLSVGDTLYESNTVSWGNYNWFITVDSIKYVRIDIGLRKEFYVSQR